MWSLGTIAIHPAVRASVPQVLYILHSCAQTPSVAATLPTLVISALLPPLLHRRRALCLPVPAVYLEECSHVLVIIINVRRMQHAPTRSI